MGIKVIGRKSCLAGRDPSIAVLKGKEGILDLDHIFG